MSSPVGDMQVNESLGDSAMIALAGSTAAKHWRQVSTHGL